jgi:hypothetical protein
VTATARLTSETGAPLAAALVSGRFLDDYWTDRPMSASTDANGNVSWKFSALCGTGAIAFLVDQAALGTRVLDRTRGHLAAHVIPGSTSSGNQAPTAAALVTCANLACTFDARPSSDDVGITGVEWRDADGTLLSRDAVWSRTYPAAGWVTVVLTVSDAGGLSGSQSVTFDPRAWPAADVPDDAPQAPVAAATVQCTTGGRCTFDGRGSIDPDGTIVKYRWLSNNGTLLSTLSTFTETFRRAGKSSATLQVTDDDGLTGTRTVQFTVPK